MTDSEQVNKRIEQIRKEKFDRAMEDDFSCDKCKITWSKEDFNLGYIHECRQKE